MDDCIFCKIAKKEIKSEFIYESDNFFVINDIKPKSPGHCLIISKKHFVNLLDLPASFGIELMDVVKVVAEKRLKEGAEGFNLMINNFPAAGQVVMHSHIHLIPRKSEDNLVLIN
ncbi:MAG: HIT domain-containing protein [Candidatus Pacearchaeota archaeon]